MASKRNQRRRSCERKVRYDSEYEADRVRFSVRDNRGVVLSAYKCRFCNGWHVGHNMKAGGYSRQFHVWRSSRPKG